MCFYDPEPHKTAPQLILDSSSTFQSEALKGLISLARTISPLVFAACTGEELVRNSVYGTFLEA